MKRSLLLVVIGFATPAFALNNRSAVSVNGLDTNPCTVASPCRAFTAAIAATSAGGEVIALDSAGYGPFVVTSSMTVSGAPGIHAAISSPAQNAITVSAAATDIVTISNLTMIGSGSFHGVSIDVNAEVRVLNCVIIDFLDAVRELDSGRMTVDHCTLLDSGTGVLFNGSSGIVKGVVSNTLIDNCVDGVFVLAPATGEITNCIISGSSDAAVTVTSLGGSNTAGRMFVESSSLVYNGVAASAQTSGTGNTAIIYLSQNVIAYGSVGASVSGAGLVGSYGNNRIAEVSTVGPLTSAGGLQ